MSRQEPEHLRTGDRGESLAAWFLRLKGYRILERNFECRCGEIDIVAWKKGTLVFVEVRTRKDGSLVAPLNSVTPVKAAKIIDTARWYLAGVARPLPPCRFDLVAVTPLGPRHQVNHIAGAFDTTTGEYVLGRRISAARSRRRFPPRRKRNTGK
ncbi:MAG: YraN family protein [bacterium]|nr:YraN family protein [bacterium]MDT8395159.1 YraN family protein [bacterium]